MFRNELPNRQLTAWLAASLIPTLLQLSAGTNWVIAIVTAVICGAAVYAVSKWGRMPMQPLLLWAQYLYIVVLLCTLLPQAAYSWPGDNYPAVPLILLALAAWSAHKGSRTAACVGCVLFWVVLGIYLFVLALGTGNLRAEWLRPMHLVPSWQAITFLLLPCGAVLTVGNRNKWKCRLLLPAGVWVMATIVAAGVLSPERLNALPDPLYTAVRSMELPGTVQRFEVLLSAGMTVGWFSLLALLLAMSAAVFEGIKQTYGKKALLSCAALSAVGMLCNVHISWWILAILATVFWAVIPILTQGLVRLKKM